MSHAAAENSQSLRERALSMPGLLAEEIALLERQYRRKFPNLRKAADAARTLHLGQVRNVTLHESVPYISHPASVAVRLIREWGVQDTALITSAILHDTVEDGTQNYLAHISKQVSPDNPTESMVREEMGHYLQANFGRVVKETVFALSNPLVEPGMVLSREEKNAVYLEHIQNSVIPSPFALTVKLSDFIDNAGSVHCLLTGAEKPKDQKQARKRASYLANRYAPAGALLLQECYRISDVVPQESLQRIVSALSDTLADLDRFR